MTAGITLPPPLPSVDERAQLRAQVRAFTRGGDVQRYHTRPQLHVQNNAAHSYGVAWLLWVLTGGAANAALLYAALRHDVPEFVTGDMPGHTKQAIGEPMYKLEDEVFKTAYLPAPALTDDEARLLKLADGLEGTRQCVRERQLGNQLITPCYERYRKWTEFLLREPREVYIWSYFNQLWSEATNA